MAEKNLKTKKDLGSPVGIVLGIIVFIIGVALQDEIFTLTGFITNLRLFLELNSFILVIGSTIAAAFGVLFGIKTIQVVSIVMRFQFDCLSV